MFCLLHTSASLTSLQLLSTAANQGNAGWNGCFNGSPRAPPHLLVHWHRPCRFPAMSNSLNSCGGNKSHYWGSEESPLNKCLMSLMAIKDLVSESFQAPTHNNFKKSVQTTTFRMVVGARSAFAICILHRNLQYKIAFCSLLINGFFTSFLAIFFWLFEKHE